MGARYSLTIKHTSHADKACPLNHSLQTACSPEAGQVLEAHSLWTCVDLRQQGKARTELNISLAESCEALLFCPAAKCCRFARPTIMCHSKRIVQGSNGSDAPGAMAATPPPE